MKNRVQERETIEQERLQELKSYNILDTLPEKGLNDLVEIASAICDTPISLISLVDESRQWFKASKGLEADSTAREIAFCRYALENKDEILVVDDPTNDERFKDNPLVTGEPQIRYYAGAPLVTPSGQVLGTICVIDQKERSISPDKLELLKLISGKVMEYFEGRKRLIEQKKRIEKDQLKLMALTEAVPGAIFQLDYHKKSKKYKFNFVSKGITRLHPALRPHLMKADVGAILNVVHPADRIRNLRSFLRALRRNDTWEGEFRFVHNDREEWMRIKASPDIYNKGVISWYGIIESIHYLKEYGETLERIAFDISHVLRGPITNLMGLVELFSSSDISRSEYELFSKLVGDASRELDNYATTLNKTYMDQSKTLQKNTLQGE